MNGMNSYIKKAASLVLALTLFGGTAVYAQEPERGVPNSGPEISAVQQREVQEKNRERVLALYNQYAPDLYNDEVELKEAHEGIHQNIQALHNEIKTIIESKKASLGQRKQQIKEQLKNGTMDRETIKSQLKNGEFQGNDELKAYREELKTVRNKLEVLRTQIQEVRQVLRQAVQSQDETAIYNGLVQLNTLHHQHIDLDQEKAGILTSILGALQEIESGLDENTLEI